MPASTKHDLAARKRARDLASLTEMTNACACEYPLVRYRNMHGHGETKDGKPCPAIAVWQRRRDEAYERRVVEGETEDD